MKYIYIGENWCHRSLKATTTNYRAEETENELTGLESLQFVSVCLPSSPHRPLSKLGGAFIGSTRGAFSAPGQGKAVFIHPFKHKHTPKVFHWRPPLCLFHTLTPLYPFNFGLSLNPAVCWHIRVCWCCYWHVCVCVFWVALYLRHAGFTEIELG